MSLHASLARKTFHFSFDARTSRGTMKDRTCWFLKFHDDKDPETIGIGECAPLSGLSEELGPDYENRLDVLIHKINELKVDSIPSTLADISVLAARLEIKSSESSILLGLEMGLLDLANGGLRKVFNSSFANGQPIPINALIWMGGTDVMLQQIEIKIRDGFRCIKLKVGGLDFERECDVLQYVRRKYFRDNIVIRLDANGAFKTDDVLYKLKELSKFGVHSIEQPLRRGSEFLPELCATSPIPVALDEELINVAPADRRTLLERTNPRFLVLKPTIHGAFSGVNDWISLAQSLGIGWWITSALESNIGLNALAQFTAQFSPDLPQGLGTGQIYEDNFEAPLAISGQNLVFNPRETWAALLND
jgi:O-succinylbenzoate synthase